MNRIIKSIPAILLTLFTQNSFADSTNSGMLPKTMTPVVSRVELQTPSLPTKENPYTDLPACPVSPICPDINGKYPPGGSKDTCPANCIAQREVDPPNFHTAPAPKVIKSVKNASCPIDYTATHVFNLDHDIVWNAHPQEEDKNLTEAEWKAEDKANYKCAPKGDVGNWASLPEVRYCSGSGESDPWYITCVPDDDGANCSYTSLGGDKEKDQYKQMNKLGYMALPVHKVKKSVQAIAGRDCNGAHWTSSPVHWLEYYSYAPIRCTPPPGYAETPNLIPTALICTHAQSTWR